MKIKLNLFLVGCILCFNSVNVFAMDNNVEQKDINYLIEFEDNLLDNATKISEENVTYGDRIKTITTYILDDGTEVVETFTRGNSLATRSDYGSDTASRTRTIKEWGSVTITASFKWEKSKYFSYVECTSVSASKSLDSKARVKEWNVDKTDGKVSVGNAKGYVDYHFYNSSIPTQFVKGTIKITCSDEGTISDNA